MSRTATYTLKGEDKTRRAFESFDRRLRRSAAAAARYSAATAAAAVAGVAVLTARSYQAIDALAKTSDRLGIATDKMQGLRLAAELSGVQTRQLDLGLQRMARRIAEAAIGTGEAQEAIKTLGLDARELTNLPLEEQFKRVSDAMGGVTSSSERVRLAFKLFDSEGVALLNTLNLGRDAIEDYTERAQEFGTALSRVDAKKVELANDALRLARERAAGIGNVIAVQTAPIVQGLAEEFLGVGGSAEEMEITVDRVINGIAVGVGLVADAFFGWRLIFQSIEVGTLRMAEAFATQFARIQRWSIETGRVIKDAIPFVDAEDSPELTNLEILADSLGQSADEAKRTLENMAAQEKPSERIAAWLQQMRIDAEQRAQAEARTADALRNQQPEQTLQPIDMSRFDDLRIDEKSEKAREAFERELEQAKEFAMTREETELEAHRRRLEILRQAYEERYITEERFHELSIELANKTQDRLNEISKRGSEQQFEWETAKAKEKAEFLISNAVALTEGIAQTSKRAFQLNKIAATAEAILSTHQAVANALATKAPWPIPLAFAAAAAAAGFARVQAIQSTTFGGGTTPSAAGTTPQVNGEPVSSTAGGAGEIPRDEARNQTRLEFNFYGPVAGPGGMEEVVDIVADGLRDRLENRDEVIITRESRQAAEIRGA